MFGILRGIGRAVFDPLNISGAFGDGGGGRQPSPKEPPQPEGLYLPDAGRGFAYKPMSHADVYQPQSGFSHGYKQFQHQSVADAPFTAQWQSGPNGPQWVEPVRKSAGSWGSQVATGPFKGNRI